MKTIGTVKTIIDVNHNEVEKVIREFYGHEYCIPSEEEIGPSAIKEVNVNTKKKLSTYDLKNIKAIRKGKPEQWSIHVLMQDMVNNDVIPMGTYMIDVNW